MSLRDVARFWIPGVCKHQNTRCIHGDEGWARMNWRGVVRRQACLDCGRALNRGLPPICTVTQKLHPHLRAQPTEAGTP
jgi:hypothetical protein